MNRVVKELQDQTLHILWVWLTLAPLFVLPAYVGFPLTGFLMGLIREISQRGVPVTFAKIKDVFATEKLDLTFWTIGGFLFWVLWM